MLMDLLQKQFQGDNLDRISRRLGTDQGTAGSAVAAALPLLLGALAKNSSGSEGAESLSRALDRDHDGSIMDDLTGFLEGGSTGTGEGILRHVFGGGQARVAGAVSHSSGLKQESVPQLLAMLAPVVMGALGKTKRQENLGTNGLRDLLTQERRQVQAQPGAGGLLSILDADGDGSVVDDIGGMLGRFLR